MLKFLKDCFTGLDNETYDLGRVLIAASTLACCFFTALTLSRFDPLHFAGGIGAILTTGGILLRLKSNTEPTDKK